MIARTIKAQDFKESDILAVLKRSEIKVAPYLSLWIYRSYLVSECAKSSEKKISLIVGLTPGDRGEWLVSLVNEGKIDTCGEKCWNQMELAYSKLQEQIKKSNIVSMQDKSSNVLELEHLDGKSIEYFIKEARSQKSLYVKLILNKLALPARKTNIRFEMLTSWELGHYSFKSSIDFYEFLLTSITGHRSIGYAEWDSDSSRIVWEYWRFYALENGILQ